MGSKTGSKNFHFFLKNRNAKESSENNMISDDGSIFEDSTYEQLQCVNKDELVDLDKLSRKIKLNKLNVISNENNHKQSIKEVLAAKRIQAVRNLKRRILI